MKMRLACGLVCALATSASASVTYPFTNITGNSAMSAMQGEAQLRVTVIDWAPGQAAFRFTNIGPNPMSITDVYFDDGTLLGIATILNGAGVNFALGASPANLPGGNTLTPQFDATAGFSADANNPAPANGVNPGEELTIVFNLINGKTYADTIAAMNGAVDLRVGIHVQAFGNGQSESFVTPAPGAAVLAGLGGLLAARRRR
ncbi:MAG: hypothetical protein SFY69_06035 [Planctomycetota bacterium]|nr:hypothetical protein [Planctomycetota bacterium]